MTSTPERPVAIVTGATGGMGRCIVADLARTHEVVAVGRSEDRLTELVAAHGVAARALDITDHDALAEMVKALSRLDVVIHAAALSLPFGTAEANAAQWRDHFAVNVFAPAELTRLALPLLRASRGTVIFIGSGANTNPAPGNVVYAASKHALQGLADSLRIEETNAGVRVSTVSPGQTDTEMLRTAFDMQQQEYVPEHYIRPESVARTVRFVVDTPSDVQITDVAVRPRIELAQRDDG